MGKHKGSEAMKASGGSAEPPTDGASGAPEAPTLPDQHAFYKMPAKFGHVPVAEQPLGWDPKRRFEHLYPRVSLPTQVVERGDVSPASHHGHLAELKKSPYSFERFDAGWEREHMEELEEDPDVDAWTKEHGIKIPYIDAKNISRGYRPDFLVRFTDGRIELHEVKGQHLIDNPNTKRKFDAAESWCEARGITFVVVTKE